MLSGWSHQAHQEPDRMQHWKKCLEFMDRQMPQQKMYQKVALKQGFFGKRKVSSNVRTLRILVLIYVLVGVVYAIVKRRGVYLVKWPRALMRSIALLK